MKKTLGILGGMGPMATIKLMERIVARTCASNDQDHIHIITDNNTDIPDRTNAILHGGESPERELVNSARILEKAGAECLLIPCNTAHFFVNEIAGAVGIPIINMLEKTVLRTLEAVPTLKTVGLLATEGTIESGIYDKYFEEQGVKVIRPVKNQNHVTEFIYDVVKAGDYSIGISRLQLAIDELMELGAESYVLGCTELSVADYLYDLKGDYVNPLEILAEEAILFSGKQLRDRNS